MARLRRTNNITVVTFEEKTRLTNFFMLLVEIDLHVPKTAKVKARKSATQKGRGKHIKKEPCSIKCPAVCNPSRTARRDLYLAFA